MLRPKDRLWFCSLSCVDVDTFRFEKWVRSQAEVSIQCSQSHDEDGSVAVEHSHDDGPTAQDVELSSRSASDLIRGRFEAQLRRHPESSAPEVTIYPEALAIRYSQLASRRSREQHQVYHEVVVVFLRIGTPYVIVMRTRGTRQTFRVRRTLGRIKAAHRRLHLSSSELEKAEGLRKSAQPPSKAV